MSSMTDLATDSDHVGEDPCPPGMRHIVLWERRCLFAVLVGLVSMITVNLALVCWLTTVLSLNTDGITHLQSFGGGVQLTANTYVQDELITSGLKTREGQPMAVRSVDNLTVRSVDRRGHSSSLHLGGDILEVNSQNFTVTDPLGRAFLSVNPDSVSLLTKEIYVSGEGGAVLQGHLLTPKVSAGVGSNLVLESAMREIEVSTPAGISIESRAGDIRVSSNQDINLQTVEGSIKLESTNVLFPGLRKMHKHKHYHHSDKIYQLCVCDNGQLFLGEADALCNTEGVNLELC